MSTTCPKPCAILAAHVKLNGSSLSVAPLTVLLTSRRVTPAVATSSETQLVTLRESRGRLNVDNLFHVVTTV